MKKITALVLSLLIILSALAGCGLADNAARPSPDATSSPAPSDSPPVPTDSAPVNGESSVKISIEPEYKEDNFFSEDGERLFIVSMGTPVAYTVKNGIKEELTAIREAWPYISNEDSEYYLSMAQDIYTQDMEYWTPLSVYRMLSNDRVISARIDSSIVTIRAIESYYTGGAHPNSFETAKVFDMESGTYLTLSDLSSDESALREFLLDYALTLSKSGEMADSYGFFEEYESYIGEIIRDGNWFFSNDGLVIIANPYDIAPYAAGIIYFIVPYEDLEGVISNSYMPHSKSLVSGAPAIADAADFDLSAFENVDDIILEEDAFSFIIYAEGKLSNVSLYSVIYLDDGSFYKTRLHYFTSLMTETDALRITSYIPEGAPNLQLSYTDSSGAVGELLVSQSGLDGSLLLIEQ